MRYAPLLLLLTAACDGLPTDPAPQAWIWEYPFSGAPCDTLTPGPSLDPIRRDSVPATSGDRRTQDDVWAEIARQAPGGWGGRFKVSGRTTIYLTRPEEAEEALPVLNELGAEVGRGPVIRHGRWDFAQLHEWRRYLAYRGVWSFDGVWMSDTDEVRNRLAYGVTADDLPRFAQLLSDLRVPCGLVVVSVGPNEFTFAGAH